MLLRFAISNCYSIRDLQVLDLCASTLKDSDAGLIQCLASPTGSILPSVVIYGANASGKTNYIFALKMMRDLVLTSHTKLGPGDALPYYPFALDHESSRTPTRVEVDFVIEGIRYHYGFELTDRAFKSEWLFSIPKSRNRLLFERDGDNFQFGRELKGQKDIIAAMTRPNSLFLSSAAQNNHSQLSRIFDYFNTFQFSMVTNVPGLAASIEFYRSGLDSRVITFLNEIGTGIIDYREVDNPHSSELLSLQREWVSSASRIFNEQIDIEPLVVDKIVKLAHRGKDGDLVDLDLDLESAGTRRLLIVLSRVFRALDRGSPIFIDEFDASLHTHAGEMLLNLFLSPETNLNGAQLIATTHDTNLINSRLLRRDQVWLAEKGSDGATELYPLTDFGTRPGDNLEKGYLQGRFGAVPPDTSIHGLGAAK